MRPVEALTIKNRKPTMVLQWHRELMVTPTTPLPVTNL